MRNVFVAAIAVLSMTGTAHASGVRAEIHGGYDQIRPDRDDRAILGKKVSGIVYGVGLGYDFDIGKKAFIGLEGNADNTTADKCFGGTGTAANPQACLKFRRDLSANVRLGANVGGNSKIYLLGGYTNLRAKAKTTAGSVIDSDAANADGVRLGAGIEKGFGSRTYAKIEYRYSNYEAGLTRNQVLAGFGVRF
jgi:outer membrane immunogenic protein